MVVATREVQERQVVKDHGEHAFSLSQYAPKIITEQLNNVQVITTHL